MDDKTYHTLSKWLTFLFHHKIPDLPNILAIFPLPWSRPEFCPVVGKSINESLKELEQESSAFKSDSLELSKESLLKAVEEDNQGRSIKAIKAVK